MQTVVINHAGGNETLRICQKEDKILVEERIFERWIMIQKFSNPMDAWLFVGERVGINKE